MLIPKGSPEGFQCQLFVMVSNGANDTVRAPRNVKKVVKYRARDTSWLCIRISAEATDRLWAARPADPTGC